MKTANQLKIKFIRANKTKFGGAENYLSRLSEVMTEQKIEHTIINSIFSKILPSWVRAILFNFQVCVNKKNEFYFSLERITCPDIYRAGDGVHKIFLTRVKKSKFNPLHLVYLYLEKKCFINAKHIIAISNMIKKEIIDSYQINEKKISVIHNGIHLNTSSESFKIKKEFSIQDEKILLYVGSGFKRKGVEEFMVLISKLQTRKIKAFIVGKEKNIKFYKQLSIKLNIEDRVIFTGPREDVENFYSISDVFILPAHYEPFGNVILEAMNGKNAVFTTKYCGGSEVLTKDYIMQDPAEDISLELDALLKNNRELNQIKNKNYIIAQQFSIEKNLSKTLKVIKKINENIN